jgi:hypothetical protein
MATGVRTRVGIIVANDIAPSASIADSGDRESPSSTMWNCDVHDRLV